MLMSGSPIKVIFKFLLLLCVLKIPEKFYNSNTVNTLIDGHARNDCRMVQTNSLCTLGKVSFLQKFLSRESTVV